MNINYLFNVTIEIGMRQQIEKKKKIKSRGFGFVTVVYFEKLWKNHKNKMWFAK